MPSVMRIEVVFRSCVMRKSVLIYNYAKACTKKLMRSTLVMELKILTEQRHGRPRHENP